MKHRHSAEQIVSHLRQADTGEGELSAQAAGGRPGVGSSDHQGGGPPKLVNPERRRRTVESVRGRLGHDKVWQRRACKALGQPRSTQRYQARQADMDRRLIAEMRRLSEAYPRYGSPHVHKLLVGTGWRVNIKRAHRLWKREHPQVLGKPRKRRRLPGDSQNGGIGYRATHRNHV